MDEFFITLEKKVYELIGRTTKQEFCKVLNINPKSLKLRLEKGVWKKDEIELINKEYKTINEKN
jgi:hypothetical protein